MKIKKLLLLALSLMLVLNLSVAVAEEDDDDNEVDLTSAVITALSCAKQAEESGEFAVLSSCPPHAAFEGIPADKIYTAAPKIVIFDVTEGEFYLVQPNEYLTYSDLLEGFGGSLDGTGVVVGEKDGIPVLKFEEEVSITPKPKPGFFKGCL
ncbi:hypothetical protein [Hydrogenivirga sp. 128-5-R1-1]|uniref:hypothetical protein n=1 Tax=Hydrogenivirga sp. 128-5-R1-1 TaxID=392423 RepID=UPI00015EF8A5|nr:hypothetical protein [Hydrogenivirga sp. 128-5-R1-1]EDP74039.1 hypothetical protein HG1285_08286 [Hydrogenivirga sp. 128-5-R1-1]